MSHLSPYDLISLHIFNVHYSIIKQLTSQLYHEVAYTIVKCGGGCQQKFSRQVKTAWSCDQHLQSERVAKKTHGHQNFTQTYQHRSIWKSVENTP